MESLHPLSSISSRHGLKCQEILVIGEGRYDKRHQ